MKRPPIPQKPAAVKKLKFQCPVHGVIENAIHSTIPGLEMYLCMTCCLEKAVELGIQKVEKIK